MKIKKLCAALVSAVTAFGAFTGIGSSNALMPFVQPSGSYSLKLEPLSAQAAGNFRRVVSNESPLFSSA